MSEFEPIRQERVQQSILIVEDEEFISVLIEDVLTELGYKARRSPNGEEALTYLQSLKSPPEHPDLILLDIKMPRKNGVEFLEDREKYPDWWETPVVIMSASNINQTRDHYSSYHNIVHKLNKPFELNALILVVQTHARQPALNLLRPVSNLI